MSTLDEMQEKMMARVEALLAKAESTEFPEERDSFIAKAQELMTKYAIEEASLRQGKSADEVTVEHIQINMDQIKYTKALALLITAVAKAQNAYVVFTRKSGNQRGYAFCTIFGSPSALDLCAMLISSLHKQMEISLAKTPIPEGVHGKTFRNNFVIAFAQEIHARLDQAKQETIRGETEKSAALVLMNEAERSEQAGRQFFWSIGKASGPTGRFSPEGYRAGKQAGQNASLARGEL